MHEVWFGVKKLIFPEKRYGGLKFAKSPYINKL